MGKQFEVLSDRLIEFIAEQKIFFVGTATDNGRVNVSPKGMDSLRVLSPSRVIWLNTTGSGNETAAHVQQNPRMTLMFSAFEGAPLILRLYGAAKVVHPNDAEWAQLFPRLPALPGARQIFDLAIDMVQTSCGMAVPYYAYQSEREQLSDWARQKGDAGIKEYWAEKNQLSIDNMPTHILQKGFGSKP